MTIQSLSHHTSVTRNKLLKRTVTSGSHDLNQLLDDELVVDFRVLLEHLGLFGGSVVNLDPVLVVFILVLLLDVLPVTLLRLGRLLLLFLEKFGDKVGFKAQVDFNLTKIGKYSFIVFSWHQSN